MPAFNPRTQEAHRAPGLQGQTGQYKEFLLGRAAEETLSVKKGGGHKRETEGTEHMHHVRRLYNDIDGQLHSHSWSEHPQLLKHSHLSLSIAP